MLALTKLNSTNLPSRDSCRCLYTVVAFPTEQEILWDLSAVLKYAGEHQLSCKPEAYAFYVFSIAQPDVILDYYEYTFRWKTPDFFNLLLTLDLHQGLC